MMRIDNALGARARHCLIALRSRRGLRPAVLLAIFAIGAYGYGLLSTPKAWRVGNVPLVLWAWRWRTPSAGEIQMAKSAGASCIFLRAGQIDLSASGLGMIRRVEGSIPKALPVDLVYNATPSFLARFESIDLGGLASFIGDQFLRQSAEGSRNGSDIRGLQLDLDVPTRLLPRYANLLRLLRPHLPQSAKLSITGLPTWMESAELRQVLKVVDFWVPQAYGTKIAEKADEFAAIATPNQVAATTEGARRLGFPFYIGLPAYGYSSLYSVSGSLVGLRGDIGLMDIAADNDFELIGRSAAAPNRGKSPAMAGAGIAGWRYDFRARADTVIDGLTVRRGETVALTTITPSGLRACARAVRERAGSHLLGICVFRLPTSDDKANLVMEQIASALDDQDCEALEFDIEANSRTDPAQLDLKIINTGKVGSIIARDAVQLDIEVQSGSVRAVSALDEFKSAEGLYLTRGSESGSPSVSCTIRRANLVRLKAPCWVPGAVLLASLEFQAVLQPPIRETMRVQADDGRILVSEREVDLRR